MKYYEEIGVIRNPNHPAAWGHKDNNPHFPDQCPECGAKLVAKDGWGAKYECGGAYTMKPQCQTHTQVFWGKCPKRLIMKKVT